MIDSGNTYCKYILGWNTSNLQVVQEKLCFSKSTASLTYTLLQHIFNAKPAISRPNSNPVRKNLGQNAFNFMNTLYKIFRAQWQQSARQQETPNLHALRLLVMVQERLVQKSNTMGTYSSLPLHWIKLIFFWLSSLNICLSIYRPFSLSLSLSLFIYLSIYLSNICLSISIYSYINISFERSIYLFIYQLIFSNLYWFTFLKMVNGYFNLSLFHIWSCPQ